MTQLFNKSYWAKARRSYLIAARQTRAVLINPEGHWKYAPNDERVAKAVAVWVEKARQAHGIVMNRRPVCVAQINTGRGCVYAA